MPTSSASKEDPFASASETCVTVEAPEYALHVAVVYDHHRSREWAEEVCQKVAAQVGQEAVRESFWRMADLTQPEVFPEAVQAAVQADLIVVCARAREVLPIDLCVWCDVWLPRRQQGTGALVWLTDVSEDPSEWHPVMDEYLRAVARKGGLDFMVRGGNGAPAPQAVREASAVGKNCFGAVAAC